MEISQPKTFEERFDVAERCRDTLGLSIPLLVDDMEDSVSRAYNAHPDRLFVLSGDGTVAYRGARGPRGFKVDEMEKALADALKQATTTR